MDSNLLLLLIIAGVIYYFWSQSQPEELPDGAVAPPVPPFGGESPITRDEWLHFDRVARAAIEQAGGANVPYVFKNRIEHGQYIAVIKRWNDDRLIRWQNESPKNPRRSYRPSGVSASLAPVNQLDVWTGEGQFYEYRKASRKGSNEAGPWNAELRGMMRAVEATLRTPIH
jgi:hypothetical protein